MFRYNATSFTVEDEERGLFVKQTGGPGHGVYAGLMTSTQSDWSLRFLVHRVEEDGDQGAGNVFLTVRAHPPKGDWDRSEAPVDLAREAAVARETGFYKTQPQRILTN